MPIDDVRHDPMMNHLCEALDRGEDIGHYGRLAFTMVAHHFCDDEELTEWLTKDRDVDETKARALVAQVRDRGYNPPKRERIREWMEQQEFPICPDEGDPNACNVYKTLKFPKEVYDHISGYHLEAAEAR